MAKEEFSPKLMEAVKEIAGRFVNWEKFFQAYLKKNAKLAQEAGVVLTETDLVAEILEAGGYQAESNSSVEDVVFIGSIAMGEDLHMFDEDKPSSTT